MHRACFLDDDEKSRAVELLRRVEELTLQFPSQPLLPYADDGEGADQADGSRPSAVAATEVSPGMSYSINTTLLTISDLSISHPNDIGAMAMRCVESHQQGFDAKILSAFTFATRQERPSYLNVYKRGLAEIEALLKGNQII